MKLRRYLAGLLTLVMLFGLAPAALAAEESAIPTRSEVCTALLAAADDYHPGITAADIMKGDETGSAQADRPVTRAEALVMLSRAFGKLPTPVGDSARWAYPAEAFSDVPAWAQTELANVFQAGIVAGTGEGKFSPAEPVTAEQLDLFIRRVYALFGTNLKDDFYAAVNKPWLDASVIPPGQGMTGGMFAMGIDVQAQVADLITGIVGGSGYAKGSGDQKISDLYHNVMDWEARNKVGVAPLKPYLQAIDKVKSLGDVQSVMKKINDELGTTLLMGFSLTVDLKDSAKYGVYFDTLSPGMPKEVYTADTGYQKDAYLKYLTTNLTLGGYKDAAAQAETFFQVEKALSAAAMSVEDQGNVDKIYNIYTMKELKAAMPNVDLDAVYALSGLKKEDKILVMDPALMKAAAAYLTEDHVEDLKTCLRVGVLTSYGGLLNKEFTDAANTYQQEFAGIEGAMTDEQVAAAQVQSLLSTYLEKAYVEKYFSAEAKADVEDMIAEFIDIYKERIEGLTWMSDTTKKMALKKLDAMNVKVGYPDQWDDTLDKVQIKSAKDGGSFFQNVVDVTKAMNDTVPAYQGEEVDKSQWICSAFDVNAFYNASFNDINFPAAILQAPMYDVKASREENLGGIGYIIAHEITHAFDNNGAKFDEKGNVASWWTEDDYTAFQTLCDQAVAYYDGAESIPGITCNGTQTLSENVADLGAAACITAAASQEKNPDYAALYTAMAATWATTSSRPYAEYLGQLDVHAANKLRGYMPAQTQAEFYEAFGIKEGDGMWIAPEDRVNIW